MNSRMMPLVCGLVPALFIALLVVSCNTLPTSPTHSLQSPPAQTDIDDSPCWSPDGRFVAYHRRFPSTDGPAGLYVIPIDGGAPRFLLQGDFFWPTDISFSPDGRYIAASLGFQIAVVDLRLGLTQFPFYATNGGLYPAWSPDGRSLAYGRAFSGSGDPPDSIGIHVVNLDTGEDRPLRHDGLPLFGGPLVWDPDDNVILAIAFAPGGVSMIVEAIEPSGASVTELDRSAPYRFFDYVRPYRMPVSRLYGVVYFENQAGWYFRSPASQGRVPFPRVLRFANAFSPDGLWNVAGSWDPESAAYVLFVGRVDDQLGTTYRRLTKWTPAAAPAPGARSAPSAPDSEWQLDRCDFNGLANHTAFAVGHLPTTGVVNEPSQLRLGVRTVPNPARADMQFELALPSRALLDAGIFDVAGRKVGSLGEGVYGPGIIRLRWSPNMAPGRIGAGVYFCRVRFGSQSLAERFVLLRGSE